VVEVSIIASFGCKQACTLICFSTNGLTAHILQVAKLPKTKQVIKTIASSKGTFFI